ncbi:MAG TPA: flagellar hook-length control protein FliK [Noviherbaspirillum sp.]|nr:flagellar hook-length control protein FliK [Noviherbaspirillum sp.]
MQTTQVSNPANMLATTSAPTKQSDASAAPEPFGKVLSREVSQRNGASEAPKGKDAAPSASGQHATKSAGKPSETKPGKESKSADQASADDETADSVAALPEELLALVANLNDMTTTASANGESQAAQAGQTPLDMNAAVDPAIVPVAAVPVDIKPTATPMPATDAQTAASAAAVSDLTGKPDQISALPERTDANKAELPLTAAQDKAPTVDDLTAQVAGRTSASRGQDFTTALSESVNVTSAAMQSVPQPALNALQQQVANAAERLTPRVGTPAWDQALGQKVVWMVAGEQQSASLTLNPPDLGPLQVVLNVSNSQANATFIAAQPEVRQALEAALPKLRDMLGEAGIQLGQANINSGNPSQQQSGFEQAASQPARGANHFGDREPTGSDAQVRMSRIQPSTSGLGLVDTFA